LEIITSFDYASSTLSAIAPANAVYGRVSAGSSAPNAVYVDDFSITNNNVCAQSESVLVTVLDAGTASASASGDIGCDNSSVVLTANPAGMTYSWTGGGSSQSISVSTAGTYYVTVTSAGGCEDVASVEVSSDLSTPSASISGAELLTCLDPSVDLTANPAGMNYLWSDGSVDRVLTVTEGGLYTVTVTGANGCSDVASKNVWNNTFGDQRSKLVGDGELCFTLAEANLSTPQMLGLNADPHTNNGYTNIDYAMYIYIRPDIDRYLIQIRENGGSKGNAYSGSQNYVGSTLCLRRTGTLIEYLMDGAVIYTSTIASNNDLYYDHSFYSGSGTWLNGYSKFTDITLCGDIELDYEWSTGEVTRDLVVAESGSYQLTVTDASGCTSVATSQVNIAQAPDVSLSADGIITCDNEDVTISASQAGLGYLWSTGETGSSITVDVDGLYSVTITDDNGCTSTQEIEVDRSVSEVAITGDDELCIGELSSVTANGSGAWVSSNSDVATVSSAGTVIANGPGVATFTFVGQDNGCSVTTNTIEVFDNVDVEIEFGASQCYEENAQLIAQATGGAGDYTYTWTGPNGFTATGQTITIPSHGNYSVMVTDRIGCNRQASTFVYEEYQPFIFALNTTVCEGEEVTLSVNGQNAESYTWSANAGSATTQAVTVTPVGPSTTYTVTVTSSLGCSTVTTAEMTVNDLQ